MKKNFPTLKDQYTVGDQVVCYRRGKQFVGYVKEIHNGNIGIEFPNWYHFNGNAEFQTVFFKPKNVHHQLTVI